jgi:hypothetical protein
MNRGRGYLKGGVLDFDVVSIGGKEGREGGREGGREEYATRSGRGMCY